MNTTIYPKSFMRGAKMDISSYMTEGRKAALIDLVLCVLLGWIGAHKLKQGKTGMFILYLFSFGLFGIGWLLDSVVFLVAFLKGEPVASSVCSPSRSRGPKNLLPSDPLPIILGDTVVMLTNGERCHYSEIVTYMKKKNVVVGYESGSSGVSIRVAKGVSYHTGGRKGAPIRDDVYEKYPGVLSITSKRVIFSGDKGTFDKNISSVSAVIPFSDGISIQFGETQYSFATTESRYIYQIISRLVQQTET